MPLECKWYDERQIRKTFLKYIEIDSQYTYISAIELLYQNL